MRTASRRYRGHRIKAVQLGSTWHASVHGHTGSILKIIESTSLADAMAQAEWFIETRLDLPATLARRAHGGVACGCTACSADRYTSVKYKARLR